MSVLRARFERHGPVSQDVIHPVEFDMPEPGAGQALVEVVAAPINPSDLLFTAPLPIAVLRRYEPTRGSCRRV